jgi:hypothetical protein
MFDAVFKRIDAGLDDFVYELHVVGSGAATDGEPAVRLSDLDWSKPIELEWKGDTKLVLKFGGANVRTHIPVVEVLYDQDKTEQVEIVLSRAAEEKPDSKPR